MNVDPSRECRSISESISRSISRFITLIIHGDSEINGQKLVRLDQLQNIISIWLNSQWNSKKVTKNSLINSFVDLNQIHEQNWNFEIQQPLMRRSDGQILT